MATEEGNIINIRAGDEYQDLGNNMVKINNRTYNTKYYKINGINKAKVIKPKEKATPKATDKQQSTISYHSREQAIKTLVSIGSKDIDALGKLYIEVIKQVYSFKE